MRPPAAFRRLETMVLMRAFGKAFGVEVPLLRGLTADDALGTYREFTATCMEMALADKRLAEALRLGRTVRLFVPLPRACAFASARYFYRGIGIGLEKSGEDGLRFCPCFFAGRYTPADCWFMSAFDEGFLRGLLGREHADLAFSCRLTEGAPHCMARFQSTP